MRKEVQRRNNDLIQSALSMRKQANTRGWGPAVLWTAAGAALGALALTLLAKRITK